MKEKNFERELPSGYKQVLYVNAKGAKFGIIFNLISVLVLVVVVAAAVISLHIAGKLSFDLLKIKIGKFALAGLIFLVAMLGYVVLHELVHGIAYKVLTGEKLTFGISWSCAFCGVPSIYTYRKTAIISVVSPLVVFTVIFIPLLVVLYFLSPLYYLIIAFVFGLHLGGCCGDIYVLYVLTAKFKDKSTLMRDTGPEQYFYILDENNSETLDN